MNKDENKPAGRVCSSVGIKGMTYVDIPEIKRQEREAVEQLESAIISKFQSLGSHGIALLRADMRNVIILISMHNYDLILDYRMQYDNSVSYIRFGEDTAKFVNKWAGFQFYGVQVLPCPGLDNDTLKAVYDIDIK